MSAFEFKALDAKGKQHKGVLEGYSERQVRQSLRDKGWAPLAVRPANRKLVQSRGKGVGFGRLSPLALALVTRQMATLVQAGLPIEKALQVVANQTENLKIRGLLLSIRTDVLEGRTLADALGKMPRLFDHQYRMTVAAGEHSGRLGEVLENLAVYTERKQQFQQEVQSALIYPVILLLMAFTIVAVLLAYVIPQVVDVFDDRAGQLPWLTQALIGFSEFMQSYLIWLVLLAGIVVIGAIRLLQIPALHTAWHGLLLNMPVVGKFIVESDVVRFASTMAILVQSSAPLLDALKVSGAVLNNLILRAAVSEVVARVGEGESLAEALRNSAYFPPLLLQMVASGESSGQLALMLSKAADYQEEAFTRKMKTLVRLFEPAMLIVMGLIIMAIVLAILLPILQFNQLIT